MKKLSLVAIVLSFAVLLVGCATPFPLGSFYTEIKSPAAAASGPVTYSKVGTASSTSILAIVATGDASIKTAAANGGIKTIKYVDYDAINYLGIYGKYTTTVYGD